MPRARGEELVCAGIAGVRGVLAGRQPGCVHVVVDDPGHYRAGDGGMGGLGDRDQVRPGGPAGLRVVASGHGLGCIDMTTPILRPGTAPGNSTGRITEYRRRSRIVRPDQDKSPEIS
jgi:hypothetical protein